MNELTFKEKEYGYKVYGEYGDVLGKIDLDWSPSFHPKKNMIIMWDEMQQITRFMESLVCRNESL